jgi:hypothetical protein
MPIAGYTISNTDLSISAGALKYYPGISNQFIVTVLSVGVTYFQIVDIFVDPNTAERPVGKIE